MCSERTWLVCGGEGSPVRKVFAEEVHLRHGGHVDFHLLVAPLLSEVFDRPLFQAGSETHASQHGRPALEPDTNHRNTSL